MIILMVFPWFSHGFAWVSYGFPTTEVNAPLTLVFFISLSLSLFLLLSLSLSLFLSHSLSLSVCLAPLRRWADSWRLWQQGHLSIAGSVGLLEVFIGWVGSPGGAYIVGRKGHPRGNKKNIYYRYWLIMVTPYPCGKKTTKVLEKFGAYGIRLVKKYTRTAAEVGVALLKKLYIRGTIMLKNPTNWLDYIISIHGSIISIPSKRHEDSIFGALFLFSITYYIQMIHPS